MKRIAAALIIALLLAFTAGCGGDEAAQGPTASDFSSERQRLKERLSKKRGRQKQKKAVRPVEESPKGKEAVGEFASMNDDYNYVADGKRDPFVPYVYKAPPGQQVQNTGPLGQFEIGQLSVTALIWDSDRPAVLVKDPGGKIHVVSEGDFIGKNAGRVIHIGDNLVLVKETYVGFEGEETTKDVEMRVKRSQGG